MIQICTLHSLSHIKPMYYINDIFEIINITNGSVKTVTISKRGYPMVTLQNTRGTNRGSSNITMHKIVALAFIENRKTYQLIEHLNDNKLDYNPNNLKFSNKSENQKSSFKNGYARNEKIFRLTLTDNSFYKGTIKELAVITKISK